jgi:predicted RNA-binding protein YlxR (DUF448 family)
MKTLRAEHKQQQTRIKHVPERTCIACRRKAGKRDLVRLIRSGETVEADLKGKKPGRGVYLCLSNECWEKGLKGNRVEHGLRIKLSADNRLLLIEYGRGLTQKDNIQ